MSAVETDLPPLTSEPNPHFRWHPLRQEWVCYARIVKIAPLNRLRPIVPFVQRGEDGFPTEIPFDQFEVAVFENRFPAFHIQSQGAPEAMAPELLIPTAPAVGRCEVMVYSAGHTDSLGLLPESRRELIVRVWADRYQELLALEPIQFVMPFENRGEAVGVTLHHPHGQIYGFSYIPPVVEKMQQAFREKPILQDLQQTMGSSTLFSPMTR